MKHKVSELEGARLDAAVAMAEGYPVRNTRFGYEVDFPSYLDEMGQDGCYSGAYSPSDNWAQGGPIIERERIVIAWYKSLGEWYAIAGNAGIENFGSDELAAGEHNHLGATPLVAAMRAYVASKFGDEVELP